MREGGGFGTKRRVGREASKVGSFVRSLAARETCLEGQWIDDSLAGGRQRAAGLSHTWRTGSHDSLCVCVWRL